MMFSGSELAIFLLTGAIAGVVAGLFGVGGGMIMVPVLLTIFMGLGFPADVLMHMALGTSLATIVVTAMSSIRAHHQHGAVRWPDFRQLLPGIVLGALFGAVVADQFASRQLQLAFGVVELLIAARLLFVGQPSASRSLPGRIGMAMAGGGIGVVSALAGIGGGTVTVPFLLWCSVPMRNAVATSAACGLPIAVFGALGYVLVGWSAPGLPAGATGFVYWPAAVCLLLTSVFFAPLGAKLAHRLPPLLLRRLFAVLLAILGLKMLLA